MKRQAYPSDLNNYEVLPENHEGVVYIVMIRLMLRRLTDNQRKRKSYSHNFA